jgi:hypothetical protein
MPNIRSNVLVLPDLAELVQRLNAGGERLAPDVFTVDEFIAAVRVTA